MTKASSKAISMKILKQLRALSKAEGVLCKLRSLIHLDLTLGARLRWLDVLSLAWLANSCTIGGMTSFQAFRNSFVHPTERAVCRTSEGSECISAFRQEVA
ncbi:hypothetical protein K443DRAFT_678326 [Laccaria amethystina LaAM-08-1]|uniref:Uncharacterized protein n=1 Tax=Laccaria amethystina LaAM-08-1 TaxID=1095629 RepID=A0A0C9XV37_9AGAR|nr:hypothetical protein K443DRAFT_678326 [Laccaria amethystina LaAM-08-1]